MTLDDYTVITYRQTDGSWVAEAPALPACYALMEARDSALKELANVFDMLVDEYREQGKPLPADSTEVVHAQSSPAA